jgi:solute:Na+ symporter, SSS family
MRLQAVDFIVLLAYATFVIGIGFWLKGRMKTSADFLTASHSLPAWVTGLSFMAANLGSLEVVGMIAMGAKYGMLTNHWYWIGAIPGMVFLGLFMVRFYYSNHIRSVPEYLRLRYDHRAHLLNSITFLIVTVLMSGINMYALALVCQQMLGWSFHFSILASAAVVATYTFLGGLSSSIYNEVLQFFLILAGFLPLTFLGLREVGGWSSLTAKLPPTMTHTWMGLANTSTNPFGIKWYTILIALTFIMGPSYWCTDFLLVQRALAARDLNSARRTPLIATLPKMLFPLLVTLPGMIAAVVIPAKLQGNFNLALPLLMHRYYPNGLLGLGFTALLASFMSGMAGNVTAFNTIWTYDIYQTYLVKNRADSHYLKIGQLATFVGTAVSIAAAYIVLSFDNLMDYMQLIGSMFISPFFVVFFLGMLSKRITPTAGFWGMVAGVTGCLSQYILYRLGVVHYRSSMAATLNLAIWGGAAGFLTSVLLSFVTSPKPVKELVGLVIEFSEPHEESVPWYNKPSVIAVGIAMLFLALNMAFR